MASSRRLNGGVVLLTTLLVVALLAALAWQMVGRHSLLIAQYRQAFSGDQALAYALGAEAFARQMLYQDWSEGGPGKDTLLEMWAQAVPPFEVENGSIEIQARDLNSCFNLNSVGAGASGLGPAPSDGSGTLETETAAGSDAGLGIVPETQPETQPGTQPGAGSPNHQRLRQLLRNLGLPDALADAWRDWVDPDQEVTGFGAEDGDYLLNDPGYRTANGLAGDVSEFRLLKDLPPEAYNALVPSLCVLPTTKLKLNVNTARPEVLAALNPAATAETIAKFTEGPRDLGDVSEFTQLFPDLAGALDALSVSSEYFEVSIRAKVDDTQVELVSVLHRDPASGRIELISRDLSRNFQSLFLAGLGANGTPP